MNIMFLGGPLDHTVREVSDVSGIPPDSYWAVSDAEKFVGPLPLEGTTRYDRQRVWVTETKMYWWTFVSAGHQPTLEHLLDTMPHNLRRSLP